MRGPALARLLPHQAVMPRTQEIASMERFFEHHLQTIAARLERTTEEALERQRVSGRDAMHGQAVLDEKVRLTRR